MADLFERGGALSACAGVRKDALIKKPTRRNKDEIVFGWATPSGERLSVWA
ncbi:MAG: hypothetical protein IT435_17690 [Phycisphaerales bacterium]|nr:hypothetical protein [Phycisphaerales bacterium]